MSADQVERTEPVWGNEADVIRWHEVQGDIVPSKPPCMPAEMTEAEWDQYYLKHKRDLVPFPRRALDATELLSHIEKSVLLRGPDFLHEHQKYAMRLNMTQEYRERIRYVQERRARERAADEFRETGVRRPHAGLSRARRQSDSSDSSDAPVPPRRGRGRPRGSKTRRPAPAWALRPRVSRARGFVSSSSESEWVPSESEALRRPRAAQAPRRPSPAPVPRQSSQAQAPTARRPGRPKGSKTRKPQLEAARRAITAAQPYPTMAALMREARMRRRERDRGDY